MRERSLLSMHLCVHKPRLEPPDGARRSETERAQNRQLTHRQMRSRQVAEMSAFRTSSPWLNRCLQGNARSCRVVQEGASRARNGLRIRGHDASCCDLLRALGSRELRCEDADSDVPMFSSIGSAVAVFCWYDKAAGNRSENPSEESFAMSSGTDNKSNLLSDRSLNRAYERNDAASIPIKLKSHSTDSTAG